MSKSGLQFYQIYKTIRKEVDYEWRRKRWFLF